MHLNLGGHPLHTRALAIDIRAATDSKWEARGYVIDLRKRGFVPVGSELQGMGIIHHMELQVVVDPRSAAIESIEARQPTVAFEASPATCGESCRDPLANLQPLVGRTIDDSFAGHLRQAFGGTAGCSHLLALMQLLAPSVVRAIDGERELFGDITDRPFGQRIFRRDLVFDGHEINEAQMAVSAQLADLHFARGPEVSLPMDRFANQLEIRLQTMLEGWPATIASIDGSSRIRQRAGFANAQWKDVDQLLRPLAGLHLGRGATAAISTALTSLPPLRDAMLMLLPALIQCRAALPDKWINQVAATPGHPGLIAMLDSCYMWRRGGGLERARADLTSK